MQIAPMIGRIVRGRWPARCRGLLLAVAVGCLGSWGLLSAARAADDTAAMEQRLSDDVRFLSDDLREGRGVGTKGIDAAADFIADQFARIGLKTDLWNGGPFQKFKITIGEKLGSPNEVRFVGPPAPVGGDGQTIELKLKTDYTPLAIGGSGKFDLPLVFAGYGITAKNEAYDDYAGLDFKGKAVVVLRHEPQQTNPHSVFDGTNHTQYALFSRKVSNAYEHGAAAVIFCNDEAEIVKQLAEAQRRWQGAVELLAELHAKFKANEHPSAEESRQYHEQIDKSADDIRKASTALRETRNDVLGFEGAGTDSGGRDLPILFCRRAVIEKSCVKRQVFAVVVEGSFVFEIALML